MQFGKKKEAHEPATIRDLYYDIVYDEAVKNMERGSALKVTCFC